MPFCGVEHRSFLAWSTSIMDWANKIVIMLAVLQLDLSIGLCYDLLPSKWGWSALASSCAHPFFLEANLNLESHTEPMSVQRPGNTPLTPCEQTGRMPSGTSKTLEGQELPGGLLSLSSDAHLLGVMSKLFVLLRLYRMLRRVILGHVVFFHVLPTCGMY